MTRRWIALAWPLALAGAASCGARSTLDEDARLVSASAGRATAAAGGLNAGGASGGSAGASGTAASAGKDGVSGSGGAAGSAGSAGARACPPLIDDMESGSGFILPCAGRAGAWYAYNDGFGLQSPPPTAPGIPLLPSSINGGRGASSRAMFSSYRAFVKPTTFNPAVNWGAGIGVDLNFDGVRYGSYDASAYDGITFWARGKSSYMEVRVSTVATTLVDYGGSCKMEFCAPVETSFNLSPDWQQHRVPFHELGHSVPDSQEPVGDAFRKDQLMNLQFLYTPDDYDSQFWLDDLAFYVEPAP